MPPAKLRENSAESARLTDALRRTAHSLVAPLITEEIRRAVLRRLKLTPKKLELLLVTLINPNEILNEQEKAMLAGRSRDFMRKIRREDRGNGKK